MTPRTQRLAEQLSTIGRHDDQDIPMHRRMALSKAITLIESKTFAHMQQADLLLNQLIRSEARKSSDANVRDDDDDGITASSSSANIRNQRQDYFRIGIAGPPGAGKSTFIEAFGKYLLDVLPQEEKFKETTDGDDQKVNKSISETEIEIFEPSSIAVVCIDPSSTMTGGSILGDKTRMDELSRHPKAFVRPSPSRGVLGGVSTYTDDVVSLCHTAGYNLVIVESVGIGQSEVDISKGVDMLILMVPPGGGDDLQGVKKGIIEVADMLVVNKADGSLLPTARSTASDYRGATHFFRSRVSGWETPPVLLVSAHTTNGIPEMWAEICRFRSVMIKNGQLGKKRAEQARYWMWKHVQDLVMARVKSDEKLREKADAMEEALDQRQISPRAAAWELLESAKDGR